MEKWKKIAAHIGAYPAALAKWLAVGALIGGIGGVIGSLFHIGVSYATQMRAAHPWILYLLPVLGRVMNAIPQPVLGGAGIVLFGSVAAAGIKTLSRVNFTNSNVLIVAVSIGVGIIPITVPEIYNHIPEWLHRIFESGISATAIFAVLLNLAFNHFSNTEEPAPAEH